MLRHRPVRQNFSTVHGENRFRDMRSKTFPISISVSAPRELYFQDRFDMKEADVKTFLDLGKRFGQRHGVTLHAGYDVYKGSGELDGYKDNILTVRPMYRLQGGKLGICAGLITCSTTTGIAAKAPSSRCSN